MQWEASILLHLRVRGAGTWVKNRKPKSRAQDAAEVAFKPDPYKIYAEHTRQATHTGSLCALCILDVSQAQSRLDVAGCGALLNFEIFRGDGRG